MGHPLDKFRDYIAEEHGLTGRALGTFRRLVYLSREKDVTEEGSESRRKFETLMTLAQEFDPRAFEAFNAYLNAQLD